MTGLWNLVRRNSKLFFKDKGMFFSSLITPIIMLILYATFLTKVYRDSFAAALPKGIELSQSIIDATVGGQLIASLLAVSCITVSFCSNMLMVQDKVTKSRQDLTMTPVGGATLSLSYYLGTLFSTLIVCYAATVISFVYLATLGWYLSFADVLLFLCDVFLLTLFGTALSGIVNFFLTSQGQISAVGTIVSAGYGFICGAYMPISQFGEGLQRVLSFSPGTYGTALLKTHALRGVFDEMRAVGFPEEVVDGIATSIDCNVFFFDHKVTPAVMYLVLAGSVLVLCGVYVLIGFGRRKHKSK